MLVRRLGSLPDWKVAMGYVLKVLYPLAGKPHGLSVLGAEEFSGGDFLPSSLLQDWWKTGIEKAAAIFEKSFCDTKELGAYQVIIPNEVPALKSYLPILCLVPLHKKRKIHDPFEQDQTLTIEVGKGNRAELFYRFGKYLEGFDFAPLRVQRDYLENEGIRLSLIGYPADVVEIILRWNTYVRKYQGGEYKPAIRKIIPSPEMSLALREPWLPVDGN